MKLIAVALLIVCIVQASNGLFNTLFGSGEQSLSTTITDEITSLVSPLADSASYFDQAKIFACIPSIVKTVYSGIKKIIASFGEMWNKCTTTLRADVIKDLLKGITKTFNCELAEFTSVADKVTNLVSLFVKVVDAFVWAFLDTCKCFFTYYVISDRGLISKARFIGCWATDITPKVIKGTYYGVKMGYGVNDAVNYDALQPVKCLFRQMNDTIYNVADIIFDKCYE